MTATGWIFEGLKPKKRAKSTKKGRKEAEIEQNEVPVRLNFDTQRIFANSRPEPVSQIMLNASETQALSFQATVRLPINEASYGKGIARGNELADNFLSANSASAISQNSFFDQLENGETLLTNVGKKDLIKIQASMILAISFMGLIIGMCIAFLL